MSNINDSDLIILIFPNEKDEIKLVSSWDFEKNK